MKYRWKRKKGDTMFQNVIKITAPNGDELLIDEKFLYGLIRKANELGYIGQKLPGNWRIEIE